MTLNLDQDLAEQVQCLDESKWSPLQAETCMAVANAKFYAFEAEAARLSEFVRCGFMTRTAAADTLHAAALYSSLYAEYGRDRIQRIVSEALREVTAA
jgi:hypothetical protein